MIEVDGLSKKYRIGSRKTDSLYASLGNMFSFSSRPKNDIWALQDVSFSVDEGDVFGIVGPNGSGKSTLLKILSRITPPTKGSAVINGRVSSLLEVGTGFHPELTGRENVFLNGSILGMRRAEIKARYDEIVEFSGVEKFIDTAVKHYSSGMYVRLAFSVAAHLQPEILLVDEVLSVGDLAFQEKSLGKMKEVAGSGRTILFVSHNLAAVRQLCNKGIFLQNGIIQLEGSIQDIISRYAGMFDTKPLFPRQGNQIRLDDLYIRDQHGNKVQTLSAGESCSIVMVVEPELELSGVYFVLEFMDAYGNDIFECNNRLTGEQITLQNGENHIVCTIPKMILTPGKYTAGFRIVAENSLIFRESGLMQFEILPGHFYTTGIMPYFQRMVLTEHYWELLN